MRPLLAVSLLAVSLLATAARADCSAKQKQLTWECGGLCDDYVPCVVRDAADGLDCDDCHEDDEGECEYECLPAAYYSESTFSYLVPFGEAARETPSTASFEDGGSDGDAFPSNDDLTAIATMDIDSDVNTVRVSSGSSYSRFLIGQFVQVELASDLLTDQVSATFVAITGVNLHPFEADLASMMPSGVTNLQFINDNISSFRANLEDAFPAVETLVLSYNNLTALDITHSVLAHFYAHYNQLTTFTAATPELVDLYLFNNSLSSFELDAPKLENFDIRNNRLESFTSDFPALLTLNLSNNQLTEFNASLPKLTALDLSLNNLTAIPSSVFDTSVQQLSLAGNPLQSPTLTTSQANFLSYVTLDITNSDFVEQPDCADKTRISVGLSVCIVQDAATPASGSASGSAAVTPSATADNSSTASQSHTGLILGVVVGVVALLLLVGALVWYCRRRRASHTGTRTADSSGHLLITTAKAPAPPALWDDAELCSLRVNPSDIRDVKKLGSGSFGVVWLVRYQDAELLASKRLVDAGTKSDTTEHSRLSRFVSEIKLVAALEHPQVVRFVGVAWKYYADLQALFEYMELGDLREYLVATAAAAAGAWDAQKLQVAVDVAAALVYVHSLAPPVVHRDLKSRNVLLTDKEAALRAKLTDFGAARGQSAQATMTAGVGTGRWIAPEVLQGSPDYGPPADMYSFGVLLSELDTHALPYADVERRASRDGPAGGALSNVAVLQMVADGALRPSLRPECPPAIRDLAAACMAQEPRARPTAPEAHYALLSARRSLVGAFI